MSITAKHTKKLLNNPFCQRHVFSEWQVNETGGVKLIKRCMYCPKIMHVKEFMEYKKEMNLITKNARLYIDLFGV